MNVGELKDVAAWKNIMPGSPPSLHVVGKITAPTPCHDAHACYTGDSKSNPPIYNISIELVARPGICIQVLSDIPFHYVEHNYAGTHGQVTVSTSVGSGDSVTVDVQTVT
ncbi:MAG: hypothetical protein KDJ29_20820 [Hyphomicrobiales bacterium]|nr:hypothetical protein [Nitratireductor sp.]MCC2099346.1 hypothetical protein [Hyphomicrobiales bacterium]